MSIESLTQQAAEAGQWRRENPEGVSVLVVTDDTQVVERVAPMLARTLYPDRRFGPILHVGMAEQLVNAVGIEVVIEDRGAR